MPIQKPGGSTTTIEIYPTLDRGERMNAFVREALAADVTVEATGEVHAADAVRAWLHELARDPAVPPPKPSRR